MHLAHPLGVKAFEYRRVKNDVRDAADLADLLRMGRLPEAWIAPPATRELRELVRHRAKLVGLRSHCKAEVHAVLAKCGIQVPMSDLFGVAGTELLDRLELPRPVRGADRLAAPADRGRWTSRSTLFAGLARGRLARDPGYVAVQTIPGIGPILGAVFVAEIGDVTRFATRRAAGLLGRADAQAPRVRHPRAPRPDHQAGLPAGPLGRGRVGARSCPHTSVVGPDPGPGRATAAGRNIGVVAAARRQLEFVFYALRDHHVRALQRPDRRRHDTPSPEQLGRSRVVQVMTPTRGVVAPSD